MVLPLGHIFSSTWLAKLKFIFGITKFQTKPLPSSLKQQI